jgi:hypothetical protein
MSKHKHDNPNAPVDTNTPRDPNAPVDPRTGEGQSRPSNDPRDPRNPNDPRPSNDPRDPNAPGPQANPFPPTPIGQEPRLPVRADNRAPSDPQGFRASSDPQAQTSDPQGYRAEADPLGPTGPATPQDYRASSDPTTPRPYDLQADRAKPDPTVPASRAGAAVDPFDSTRTEDAKRRAALDAGYDRDASVTRHTDGSVTKNADGSIVRQADTVPVTTHADGSVTRNADGSVLHPGADRMPRTAAERDKAAVDRVLPGTRAAGTDAKVQPEDPFDHTGKIRHHVPTDAPSN